EGQAGTFDTLQLGWSGRIDPDQNIQPFWDPESSLNYAGTDNDEISKLIVRAERTSDQSERADIYRQLLEKFLTLNNLIYLYHEKYVLAMGTNVSGVQYFGDGLIRLKTAS